MSDYSVSCVQCGLDTPEGTILCAACGVDEQCKVVIEALEAENERLKAEVKRESDSRQAAEWAGDALESQLAEAREALREVAAGRLDHEHGLHDFDNRVRALARAVLAKRRP